MRHDFPREEPNREQSAPTLQVLTCRQAATLSLAQVTLRCASDYTIIAEKEGYQQVSANLQHSVDWYTFLGNIIFGGLIGWAIDFSSGSAYELSPDSINIPLMQIASQSMPSTAQDHPVGPAQGIAKEK
jgi:hypothetical protein